MRHLTMAFAALAAMLLIQPAARAGEDDFARVREANTVFSEIMAAPDEGIPQELLDNAHCVVIIPGMKRAGFIVGGRYGVGVATCRKSGGGWTAPSTVKMEGGSIGFQIGAGETDLILMMMNEGGKERLLKSEFTIGGEAAAMVGPVGRQSSAETDGFLTAQILSYSRSRGVFAGVNVKGATLRPDDAANKDLYGKPVSHHAILDGKVAPPAVADALLKSLTKYSPYEAGKKTTGS